MVENGQTPNIEQVGSVENFWPIVVSAQTGKNLDFYFSREFPDVRPFADFFEQNTLNYIGKVERGFRAVDDKVKEMTPEEVEEVLRNGGLSTLNPDIESRAAFNHSVVVFSQIPEILKLPWFPVGFSRRGMMRPPATRTDFLFRIFELKDTMGDIASKKIAPSASALESFSLLRTYAFFKTSERIAVKVGPGRKEIRELDREIQGQQRKMFNDLLGDIPGLDGFGEDKGLD